MHRYAPSCPPRLSVRRKRRTPPWTTLYPINPRTYPLKNRGLLFKQAEPLLQMQKALDPKLLGTKANLLVGSPGKDGQRHWTLAEKEDRRKMRGGALNYTDEIGGHHPNPPDQGDNGRRNFIESQKRQKLQGDK